MDIAAIAETFRMRLRSFSVQKMASKSNLLNELDKLEQALKTIEHTNFWDNKEAAKMLREVFYDVEYILDAYEINSLRIQLQNRKKLLPYLQVRQFLCRVNSLAFRVKMSFELQNVMKRLQRIQSYGKPEASCSMALDVSDVPPPPPYLPLTLSASAFRAESSSSSRRNAVPALEPRVINKMRRSGVTATAAFRMPKIVARKFTRFSGEFSQYGDVMGRENEKERIVEALLKRENERTGFVLPIVGVHGIGKTALMKLVYNDKRIADHFQLRIWLDMSQSMSAKKLVETMIKCTSGNRSMLLENYEMDELKIMLQRILHTEVYLLVLDDVGNKDERNWEELKELLLHGANGSKVVVTTCNESIASLMGTRPMYVIDRLSDEDCISLFLKRVFQQGQKVEHLNLRAIGANIAEKCAGIPLSVNLLGGLLHEEFRVNSWKKIRDHSILNSQQSGNFLPALTLSFEELPSHLKACLSYCSIFPRGCDIEIDKLIQLWMAEGLIQPVTSSEELEYLGLKYFNDLYLRSFFQDTKVNGPLLTSASKMHNHVHDFVVLMTETEYSMVSSHTQDIIEDVKHVAFLDYDMSGKELPSSLLQHHSLRTIFFPVDGIGANTTSFLGCLSRFMDLRTLDLSDSCFEMLPGSIGELKHLKYLDLSGNGSIQTLHIRICNLQSLQTLRAFHCPQLLELPRNADKLISLRHLYITTKQDSFPDKVVGRLTSLRSLLIYGCQNLMSLSEELQCLTNLRTLALVNCPKLTFLPSSMKHLTALENLKIIDCKELTLFEWEDIEGLKMLRSLVIGGLPELDAGDVQCFENLQSLIIAGLPQLVSLPRWLEGSASTFRYLKIARCPNFTALPEWLQNLTKLKEIEISECFNLTSLPEGMQNLTGLKVLKMENCPELSSRCRGEDRYKIAQIPKVSVNGMLIQ